MKGEEHATYMRKSGESCGENGARNESKVVCGEREQEQTKVLFFLAKQLLQAASCGKSSESEHRGGEGGGVWGGGELGS